MVRGLQRLEEIPRPAKPLINKWKRRMTRTSRPASPRSCPLPKAGPRARPPPAGAGGRQSEGRRRQDHDRDQSRHRAGRDRRARADRRSRPAGQCFDRARHRPRTARISTYDVLIGEAPMRDGRAADRGAATFHRALDARSLRPRARDRPARATALSACAARSANSTPARARTISPTCWSTARRRSIC